jgi:Trypsin-like peptidase domain
MEILRTFFDRHDDRVWQINDSKSVELLPANTDDVSLYKVQDDVFTVQPDVLGSVCSILGRSIVPIVARELDGSLLRAIGTGFFVSCTGLLITAAHVIQDPMDRKYGDVIEVETHTFRAGKIQLGVMLPLNPLAEGRGFRFIPIEWASFLAEKCESPLSFVDEGLKLTTDIAICKVQELNSPFPFQPLAVIQPGIKGIGIDVGKQANALGYGGMRDLSFSDGKALDDFSFDLYVSKGRVIERFPKNLSEKTVPTPGPCFSTDSKYPGGMSGSPIFDDEGIYVHGVVSRGLEGAQGPEAHGYGSMIAPSLSLPIKNMQGKSLIELMKEGDCGMPQLLIPDA